MVEAELQLEIFVRRFNSSYKLIAYYAALPLILTPELLNYLRSKFLHGQVPWVAEADLLLSDLCKPVGYEQYVMNTAVRAYLLKQVRKQLGLMRMREVAQLLIHYVHYISRTNPFISKQELQSQQWAAMVYLEEHRKDVAREIAESFRNCISPIDGSVSIGSSRIDEAELARLIRITEVLNPELKTYPELIEYAECVRQILSGLEVEELYKDDRWTKPLQVLGVKLPA